MENRLPYFEHFLGEIEMWQNRIWPSFASKLGLHNLRVVDIGGAAGAALISMKKTGLNSKSTLVDPNFDVFEKYLKPNGFDADYFNRLDIEINRKCGNDVEYINYDLIIKTYNGTITWETVVNRTNAKFFLTSSRPDYYFMNNDKFQLVAKCNISQNEYLLYKRI